MFIFQVESVLFVGLQRSDPVADKNATLMIVQPAKRKSDLSEGWSSFAPSVLYSYLSHNKAFSSSLTSYYSLVNYFAEKEVFVRAYLTPFHPILEFVFTF